MKMNQPGAQNVTELPPIYLDTRDNMHNSQHVTTIKEIFPNVQIKQLPIGDLVCGNACIELKTVPDLLSSITDGRLRTQPLHMQENFPNPLILVLGSLTDVIAQHTYNNLKSKVRSSVVDGSKPKRELPINAIFGAIASITSRHHIPIQFLEDVNMSTLFNYLPSNDPFYPKYIVECQTLIKDIKYKHAFTIIKYFIEKSNDGRPANTNPIRRMASSKEILEHILMSWPKVSITKAERLLEKFGTIQNVVNATTEEISSIERFGPKSAKQFVEISTLKCGKSA